jgi:hypothetical protein
MCISRLCSNRHEMATNQKGHANPAHDPFCSDLKSVGGLITKPTLVQPALTERPLCCWLDRADEPKTRGWAGQFLFPVANGG